MRQMRHPILLALLIAASCFRPAPPPLPTPLQILEIGVEPAAPRDRIARIPTFLIRTDRELAPAGQDTAWLIAGLPTDSLRTDAARGTLSSSAQARRIDATVTVAADDPTQLRVTPRQPLAPDASLVLVIGTRLVAIDGTHLSGQGTTPGTVQEPFRVAPARECPPIARMVFPSITDVPRDARTLMVTFDRPMTTFPLAPLRIVDPSGSEIPLRSRPGCVDPDGGARCLVATPLRALDLATSYRLVLQGLADDGGLEPQLADAQFATRNDGATSPMASPGLPLVCATEETALPPFCLRADRGALVLRGQTTTPGALLARFGTNEAQSAAGTDHLVRLAMSGTMLAQSLHVWPVALDGTPSRPLVFAAVDPPGPRAPLRITELLAHPRSTSAQEFVEIVNVSSLPFTLHGFRLATPSGSAALPDTTIESLTRAVIVGASFDPRGAPGDPAIAAGAQILRLEGTLAGHGLADRGADVWLVDDAGQTVSRAPTSDPTLAPRTGISVVRADPRLDEDDPSGWSYDALDGSTPGLPDRLR